MEGTDSGRDELAAGLWSSLVPMVDTAHIRESVESILPAVLDDLVSMVAIPSISSHPDNAGDVQTVAETIVAHLEDLGCCDASIVSAGGAPAVIAHFLVDPALPTVCLYAHMDVQPTGDVSLWTTPPFEATVRGDRLFGRGTADDKAGVTCHLAALRAFDGKPPVNVTVLIEGEEEMGSPTLGAILEQNKEALTADLYVIADCGNWKVGQPAFTTSLRGVVDCVVEVTTLKHSVHSGQFGGVVPDALTTLCRLLATLHDKDGNVAVEGLVSKDGPDLDYSEQTLREEAGLLDSTQVIGSGPLASRSWTKPSISVIGLDTTSIEHSSNTIIPSAKARISLRVAPGDNGEHAYECLKKHLEDHIEWGATLTLTNNESGQPCEVAFEGQLAEKANRAWTEAFGVEPVLIGTGGSIGMIAEFQKGFPNADVLCIAVSDPDCRMHGIDESLYLPDWKSACLAEALLLAEMSE